MKSSLDSQRVTARGFQATFLSFLSLRQYLHLLVWVFTDFIFRVISSPCRRPSEEMPGKTKRILLVVAGTLLAAACFVSVKDLEDITTFPTKRLENLSRIKGPLSGNDTWVLKYVNETHLFPPSTEPYNLSKVHDKSYTIHAHGDTWSYIHRYIRHMFDGEPPGFFLEAGALDGEFLSNTLWLERTLGWTGLLIEADKESFRLLQMKHRKAWTSNACISKENYPMESYFVTPVVWEKKHELWANRLFYPANAHLLGTNIFSEGVSSVIPAIEHYSLVQCFPLITFVQALGVKKIDFLSLDLQGNEKIILKYFFRSTIKVRVVIIEDQTDTVDYDFIKFMETCNYQLINKDDLPKSQDHIYIDKNETILIEKFKEWKNDIPI